MSCAIGTREKKDVSALISWQVMCVPPSLAMCLCGGSSRAVLCFPSTALHFPGSMSVS